MAGDLESRERQPLSIVCPCGLEIDDWGLEIRQGSQKFEFHHE